jgi:hypothetical protein
MESKTFSANFAFNGVAGQIVMQNLRSGPFIGKLKWLAATPAMAHFFLTTTASYANIRFGVEEV